MAKAKTKEYHRLTVDELKKCNREKLLEFLSWGDGHSVYDAALFNQMGLPTAFVEQNTKRQGGGSDYRSRIYNSREVEILPVAVYGLSIYRQFGDLLGVSSSKMGRGFEAQELCEGLCKIVKEWPKN